jgi:hypothetical protein
MKTLVLAALLGLLTSHVADASKKKTAKIPPIDAKMEMGPPLSNPAFKNTKFDKKKIMKKLTKNTGNKDRPMTTWPRSFKLQITNDEPGLTLTETMYFVRNKLCLTALGLDKQENQDIHSLLCPRS